MKSKLEGIKIGKRKLDLYYHINNINNNIEIFLIQDGQILKDIENNIVEKLLDEYRNICLVFIYTDDRNKEYTPWKLSSNVNHLEDYKGGADYYIKEIKDDIVPFIKSKLNIEKYKLYLVGSSLGGLVSTYGLVNNSLDFSGGVFVSSSYWYIGFIEYLKNIKIENTDLKIYMDVGNKEGSGKINYNKDIVRESKKVYKILLAKKIPKENIKFLIQKDMHHDVSFFVDRIYDGIKFILS